MIGYKRLDASGHFRLPSSDSLVLHSLNSQLTKHRARWAIMAHATFIAAYTSPTGRQTFSTSLPALPSDPKAQDIKQKTAYLSSLRSGATQMQGDLNAYLTQKMEEEKGGKAGGAGQSGEETAEELYGEEGGEPDACG